MKPLPEILKHAKSHNMTLFPLFVQSQEFYNQIIVYFLSLCLKVCFNISQICVFQLSYNIFLEQLQVDDRSTTSSNQ